jgi:hypothetical protein
MGDTLTEIIDLIYLRADISSADSKFGIPTMTRIVNLALRQISTEFECFWLNTSVSLAVVAADYDYALTDFTRFHKARRVTDDLHVDLQPVNPNEIEEYLQSTNKPHVWTVEEGYLKLGMIPDAAYTYTLHFTQYEAPLQESDDTPALPAVYTDFLAVKGGIIAATRARDPEMVGLLREEFKDWKRRISDDMRQMRPAPHVRVRPR